MYDRVNYILDLQPYLYKLFEESERGRFFREYSLASFIICLLFFVSAVIIAIAVKPLPQSQPGKKRTCSKYGRTAFLLAFLFSLFLFLIRNTVVFEYMDLAYFYEGQFKGFNSFLSNTVYFSNIHRPGYLLISFLIRKFLGGSRDAYILLNLVALAAAVPYAFRLLSRNLSEKSSLIAVTAYVVSPMTIYSAFRISPYMIIAFLFVFLVESYAAFRETGEKKFAAAMMFSVFLLPFFHVLTAPGILIFFIAAAWDWKSSFLKGGNARGLAAAVVLAAIGSALFNLAYLVFFRNEIVAISTPSTTRLGVYYSFSDGNLGFFLFCLKTIPNILISFISQNPWTAAMAGMLFLAGGAGLFLRAENGKLLFALGLLSGGILILTNASNKGDFSGFPMSYRHLQMMSFFYLYAVFFACDRMGKFLSERLGTARPALCLLLLSVFILGTPGLITKLQSPDMRAAMRFVYGNIKEYDGVIPGNIYFMNDFHNYFLSEGKGGYNVIPATPKGGSLSEITTHNFNSWNNLIRSGGRTVYSVMLNAAPVTFDSHNDVLKCSFIQQIWYFDNDTRFLGRLPDFSGKYERGIRDSLRNFQQPYSKEFNGVTVRKYIIRHEPIRPGRKGYFQIKAGVNDYYFVKGAVPDVTVPAVLRTINESTYILFYVPSSLEAVRIELFLEKPAADAPLTILEMTKNKGFRPVNKNRRRPIYIIPKQPGINYIYIGFKRFGRAAYREIRISGAGLQSDGGFEGNRERVPHRN